MENRERKTSNRMKGQKKPKAGTETNKSRKDQIWVLRLYVAGQTPKSIAAFGNLKQICEEHLAGKYRIEVIDLMENPKLAEGAQILAIPTLVRTLPPPLKKIIGDLSDTERVLVGLQIKPSIRVEVAV